MRVTRFDMGSLGAAEKMPNGWLKAPGRFTRAGVFTYRNQDGSTRKELRLPEEVFSPAAMKSFAMVPVTLDHPPGLLDSSNTNEYSVGHTGENLVQDGDYLCGPTMVTKDSAIAAVEGGKQELSCGYTCALDDTPGTHPVYGAYDVIQRDILGNHLAIVDKGRAGPTARLQLDRMDAVQIDTTTTPESGALMKKTIHGVEYEVTDQVGQAIDKQKEAAQKRYDDKEAELLSAKALLEKEKARADSASEDLTKEKKLRADAENPEAIKAKVKARLDLETSARKVLGSDEKLDALSEAEIKTKVVQKVYPSADLKNKSADYLQARFDSALEKAPESTEEATDTTRTTQQTVTEVRADAAPSDVEAKRQKTIKEENERFKKVLKG